MTTTSQYLIVTEAGAVIGDGWDLVHAAESADYLGAYLIHMDASPPMPVGVEESEDEGYCQVVGGWDSDSDESDELIEVVGYGGAAGLAA